jgi:hypothetical protein
MPEGYLRSSINVTAAAVRSSFGQRSLSNRCGIALGRRLIAAGTRSDDFDRLTGAQSAGCVGEVLHSLARAQDTAPAGAATLEPRGGVNKREPPSQKWHSASPW